MTAQFNPGVNMMIHQQVSRYQSDLTAWSGRVRASGSNLDAFRHASHKPTPGALIRSLRSLTNADKNRAENIVERVLEDRASKLSADDPQFLNIMRMTQGHWPQIWRSLDQKRRLFKAVASD